MVTTQDDIRRNLYYGRAKGYSHMMMVCDTWDYTDYPVFVPREENIKEYKRRYQNYEQMSKIVEIYSYDMDLEHQLLENRAWHEEVEKPKEQEGRKSFEWLKKLPEFENSNSCGAVEITHTGSIPFDQMTKITGGITGYIDKDGNLYPALFISSTAYDYHGNWNISFGHIYQGSRKRPSNFERICCNNCVCER